MPVEIELEGVDAPPELVVAVDADADGVRWSLANETGGPVAVERVRLRWRMRARGDVRVYRHGWQSWSPTGGGVLGRDVDPPRGEDVPDLLRDMYHADPRPAAPGELRSELVTVLADDAGAVLVGFDGGARHDGTLRVRPGSLVAEAYLGGARLAPGECRALHALRILRGAPTTTLAAWAAWAGAASAARTTAPYRVGWCSWYQYFHDVDEVRLRDNLARARDWPFDVFQLDDGYQAAVGDWLRASERFPSGLERLAADVARAGYVPGLWLAPFLASPSSALAAEHPDWFARHASGYPLIAMVNPGWGGVAAALDTTHPAVLGHLERLARTLVDMGWRYLKLDFTYAAALDGEYVDPTRTPAERVRLGFDAVRRGAGDDVFLLGCGAPLGPGIGVVDAMRIGPDVAPAWAPSSSLDGYEEAMPATRNAWRNTLARAFQHRRLWVNDPDCLMLRRRQTALTGSQVEAWTAAVAASGGLVVVSDDLALLDGDARRRLDEALAVSRRADAAARAGDGAVCPDVVTRWTPRELAGGGIVVSGDPDAGTARRSDVGAA